MFVLPRHCRFPRIQPIVSANDTNQPVDHIAHTKDVTLNISCKFTSALSDSTFAFRVSLEAFESGDVAVIWLKASSSLSRRSRSFSSKTFREVVDGFLDGIPGTGAPTELV